VTHTMPLEQAPEGYRIFQEKEDRCIKVVLKPWLEPPTLDAKASEPGQPKPHLH